ncbi:MAG: helix-turn-helix domain-containing protein [Leptolyngbyaceae cyanobacterium bins.302]|nr:helix-turn-helix domain-containing protein [Leptolyngbyaceae cyanobacterium bins.302]
MTISASGDRTTQLRHLMQQAELSSYKALSQAADVSEKQIRNLRQGKLATMRLETVIKLSQALQVSLEELVTVFGVFPNPPTPTPKPVASPTHHDLRQEYDRLQAKLNQQKQEVWQEFQQSSLQVLESLLLQLPTAMYAAQQNPQAPAVKLLPLLRPIDALLQQWGIEPIATVGAEVAYDPQQHQLMEGNAAPDDRVRVRYVGYRQGDRLLYRAKVSPLNT